MIDRYVEALSTYANDIDNLILLIGALVGFWFVLCEVIFFYFIIRFRAKDGQRAEYISGEEKTHKRWISYPHLLVLVCDVFIVFFAIKVWYEVKQ
ncbi:MAG TPA: cytochrome C oxidase subunit II, partial [Myxococcota bacterium]